MNKILHIAFIMTFVSQLAYSQVKELSFNEEQLSSFISSLDTINNFDKINNEAIDSIIKIYPSLKYFNNQDLTTLYYFHVPKAFYGDLKAQLTTISKCEQLGAMYTDKIANSAAAIVEKYPGTNEDILLQNFKPYFKYYLLYGLAKQGKLDLLDKYDPSQISNEQLDKLFIEAKGTEIDNLIYFVMAHSSRSLFELYSAYENELTN